MFDVAKRVQESKILSPEQGLLDLAVGVPVLSGEHSEKGLCAPGTVPHTRQLLSKYFERIE